METESVPGTQIYFNDCEIPILDIKQADTNLGCMFFACIDT
jgi:hypothetical protein